jgi:hypothetical protein
VQGTDGINLKLDGYNYLVVITGGTADKGHNIRWRFDVKYASDAADSGNNQHTAGDTKRCKVGGWDNTKGGLDDLSTTFYNFYPSIHRDIDC